MAGRYPSRVPVSRHVLNQGMNWIRPEKRLAIYLRDGMACVYCGTGIEAGAQLTLDHVTPYRLGGDNSSDNLITSCHRCNSRRGDKPLAVWCRMVKRGSAAEALRALVHRMRARVIDVASAKRLMKKRGGFVAACRRAA